MSAVPSPALENAPQRAFPRHRIQVPLDLIALRSGVPETLPGRCTDISEAGVGAVVAGELSAGQQVAVELRLPNVGVPMRARAVVRYQSRLRCGLEFTSLSVEQREMICYWVYRSTLEPARVSLQVDQRPADTVENLDAAKAADAVTAPQPAATHSARIRIGRRALLVLLACILALAALAWWQWQRSWGELESRPGAQSGLRVSPETMEKRILTKVDPLYPESARQAGMEGMVVLEALIAPDGSVRRLRPLSGPDPLAQAAIGAVQSWKFEPYLSSGQPVEVETTIAVEFRLN